jgi:alanine racemase
MSISRRGLLTGAAASTAVLAHRQAAAAPPLTPQPRSDGGRSATRHNAWLEVDAAGFESNLRELQRQVGDLRSVCLVAKADAYGHGLDLLMPSIRRLGISWLGITSTDEARVIRAHGFRGRILRLRVATADEVEDGLRHRIEEMVGGLEVAENAARIAARRGIRLPVHLAINSMGMSREGLDLRLEANRAEALKLLALPQLRLAGVMDHCPVNTIEEHREGARRFMGDANRLLASAGIARSEVLLHCANSFGSLNLPENRLDLMRVGRAVYGHGGSSFPEFRFFSTFKARVASVGSFPAGATVSYERAYTLRRESRLANIPVGYSDGYRRVFSATDRQVAAGSRLPQLLIQGRRVPVVGLVTMNVLVADVTDLPEPVRAGDEVVLYGRQGNETITIDELMGIAATNPPDLYTLWGNSLPKMRL